MVERFDLKMRKSPEEPSQVRLVRIKRPQGKFVLAETYMVDIAVLGHLNLDALDALKSYRKTSPHGFLCRKIGPFDLRCDHCKNTDALLTDLNRSEIL